MKSLFITVLNMSITGSFVILAIMLARLLIKKAPKKYSYVLWLIPAFRLICPFSFRSVFSIFNLNFWNVSSRKNTYAPTMNFVTENAEPYKPEYEYIIHHGVGGFSSYKVEPTYNMEEIIFYILSLIWIIGTAALLIYGLISYYNLKTKICDEVYLKDNIYVSKYISSPFVLGFIKPKIYIPEGIEESALSYVILHENCHIKKKDHIIKLISYLILCIHWFNPLCWLAFFEMTKDMEMSCDEKVLKENEGIKKNYSLVLLSFASGKKMGFTSPIAFGETSVKSRIKNVLSYKKPIFITAAAAAVILSVIAVVFASNPATQKLKELVPVASTKKCSSYAWIVGTDYNTNRVWYQHDEKFADELEDIEISLNPLADSEKEVGNFVLAVSNKGETYEKDYVYINFSKDYTKVWINDIHLNAETESSEVYKVLNPQKVKVIIESTRDGYYQNYVNIMKLENDFTLERAENEIIEIFIDKSELPELNEIPSDDEDPIVMYEFENDGLLVYDGETSNIYLKYLLRLNDSSEIRFDFRTVYDVPDENEKILIYGEYHHYFGIYESKPFGDYLKALDNKVYDGEKVTENGIRNVGNMGVIELLGIGRSAHIEAYMDEKIYEGIENHIRFNLDVPCYVVKPK